MSNTDKSKSKDVQDPHLEDVEITPSMETIGVVSDKEKEMINEYSYIIDAVASIITSKKKLPASIDYNDLISVGFDGLLKAIRGFDETKDAQFKTYANIRVRGSMLDLIRKEWRAKSSSKHNDLLDQIKQRVAQVIDNTIENEKAPVNVKNLLSITTTSYMVSLENVMEAYGDNVEDKGSSVDSEFELDDEYQTLNKIILDLPKEDVKFIELFYRRGLSQKEISVQLNMSEATVSRLHHRVIT
ncbi:hypothetical protein DID73_02255, partial [Candidatus Marinamargulisbacteria bacterium SCGC AG-343-K17]